MEAKSVICWDGRGSPAVILVLNGKCNVIPDICAIEHKGNQERDENRKYLQPLVTSRLLIETVKLTDGQVEI